VIVIWGGLVQAVHSDIPVQVHVLDSDVVGWGPEEESHQVHDPDSVGKELVDKAISDFETNIQNKK
jgi:hypothetical protein